MPWCCSFHIRECRGSAQFTQATIVVGQHCRRVPVNQFAGQGIQSNMVLQSNRHNRTCPQQKRYASIGSCVSIDTLGRFLAGAAYQLESHLEVQHEGCLAQTHSAILMSLHPGAECSKQQNEGLAVPIAAEYQCLAQTLIARAVVMRITYNRECKVHCLVWVYHTIVARGTKSC
jgi:hypothetical protein